MKSSIPLLTYEQLRKLLQPDGTPIPSANGRPKIVQIGNLSRRNRKNPNRHRVYDVYGIAPALTTCGGGISTAYCRNVLRTD
jgi:hypothetical protein